MARVCKKCDHCGVSDTPKDQLILINKKYVHDHCLDDFKKKAYLRSLKKCVHCEIKDTPKDELMIYEEEFPTRTVKQFLHKECYEEYVALSKQKQQDRVELVELDETLKRIFNVTVMPNMIYVKLANVRSGGGTGYRDTNKGAKNGYSYAKLNEGFLKCEGDIDYAISHTKFYSFANMFAYCLEIVVSYLTKLEVELAIAQQGKSVAEGITSSFIDEDDEDDYDALAKYIPHKKEEKKKSFFDEF